jgi:hypothetical protein
MTVRQINLCGEPGYISGIQAIVQNKDKIVNLTPIGRMVQCENWVVPNGDYIEKIELSYNVEVLTHIQLTTHNQIVVAKGFKSTYNKTYTATFKQSEPFVGFAAYQGEWSIAALGLIGYKCAVDPAALYLGNVVE